MNWKLLGVLTATFILRVIDLDYNGPYIDESFYSVIKNIGNTHYITSEVYLWPLVSFFAHAIGGVTAARFVSAVFNALTAGFVYKIAEVFSVRLVDENDNNYVPLFTSLFFALSAPAMYIGTLAGNDSMAFMLYSLGFWQMAKGIDENSNKSLFIGAITITVSVATRYMVFMYLPVAVGYALYAGILDKNNKTGTLMYFILPLTIFTGTYWAIQHDHIVSSIIHARNIGKDVSGNQSVLHVIFMAFIRTAPVFMFSAVAITDYAKKHAAKDIPYGKRNHLLFLTGAALLVVAYHIYSKNDFTMNRNIALGVIFGSIVAGSGLNIVINKMRKTRSAVLAVVVLGFVLFFQAKLVVNEDRNWADWRPVVKALKASGIDRNQKIWCTTPQNVWMLVAEFGDGVNCFSPWYGTSEDILKRACMEKIDIVVGPFSSHSLIAPATMPVYGYRSQAVVNVPNSDPVYIFTLVK